MNKISLSGSLGLIALFIILILSFPQTAAANLLEVNGRIQLYNPPEAGASTTLMYGLGANLNFSSNFCLQSAVEYASYSAGGHNYSLLPVTADLIYRFMPGMPLDPYLGAGLGFYTKNTDGVSKTSTGAQLKAGADISLGFFSAGLEARYVMPNLSDSSQNSFSYGLNLGGSVFIPF